MAITLADIEAARRVIEGSVLRTPMLPAPRLPRSPAPRSSSNTRTCRSPIRSRTAARWSSSRRSPGRAGARRHRHVGRQSRAGGRLPRRAPRYSGDDRDAGDDAVREGGDHESHGAEVVLRRRERSGSANALRAIQTETQLTLVHPYDDDASWPARARSPEMLEEVPDLDCIVIPIGGGGLIAGNAIAAGAVKPGIEIIGAEAALYPSVWNALRARTSRSAARLWPKASRSRMSAS